VAENLLWKKEKSIGKITNGWNENKRMCKIGFFGVCFVLIYLHILKLLICASMGKAIFIQFPTTNCFFMMKENVSKAHNLKEKILNEKFVFCSSLPSNTKIQWQGWKKWLNIFLNTEDNFRIWTIGQQNRETLRPILRQPLGNFTL